MAKKPEKHPISKAFEDLQARIQEENRQKGYADLIKYGENLGSSFPHNAVVSAFDTAAPYYGDEADAQLEAAKSYAQELQQSQSPKVTVLEKYYEDLKKQVRVVPSEIGSMYIPKKEILGIQDPITKANQLSGLSDELATQNNYISKKALNQYLLDSVKGNGLPNLFRESLEHEAGHIPDSNVKFAKKPPLYYDSSEPPKVGYMGNENHFATGLSKVQREQYAMTGKRFESPNEYKSFILNVARADDPESEIAGFSEEAKRALRAQIENAKSIIDHQNQLDQYNKSGPVFRFLHKEPQLNPQAEDFFEKSATLIPALVSNQDYKNYTS